MCSVEFNRKEEKKWFEEIPSQHHAAVKVITEKNEERLKLLKMKTKKDYGYHMLYEKVLL